MALTDAQHRVARGFTEAGEADFAALDVELAPERRWYAHHPRYQTDSDIEFAFVQGRLVELPNDTNVRRLARFEGASRQQFKPYLTPNAVRFAQLFGELWRQELSLHYGIDDQRLRLAVTSMVRSQTYQDDLIRAGKLASADTTHTTGNTLDFDGAGYYIVENGTVAAHGHPARATQRTEILDGLKTEYGEHDIRPHYRDDYDPRVLQCARDVAFTLEQSGIINLVPEFTDTPNAVLHIATNPGVVF